MKTKKLKKRDFLLTLSVIIILLVGIYVADIFLDYNVMKVINLCGIFIILSLSMILINGFIGQFSLGHAGFMAIGAYTCAFLTMNTAETQISFLTAVFVGGLVAAFSGLLVGAIALRLKGDYLAIVTLGFAEAIRIIFTNLLSTTNGMQGITDFPQMYIGIPFTNITFFKLELGICIWIIAVVTVLFMVRLVRGSYGRAFIAIREDEVLAETMGVNIFKHKLLAFVISSFFAGVGGALFGNIMQSIDPSMFNFLLTFSIILMVVLGGIGSITGGIISAIIITLFVGIYILLESNFYLDSTMLESVPELIAIIFSILILAIVIFKPKGIMGNREFTWQWIMDKTELPRLWIMDKTKKIKEKPDSINKKTEEGCDE